MYVFLAHGVFKFDSTTNAGINNAVEFKTGANHNLSSQKLNGTLEVKYKALQYGILIF